MNEQATVMTFFKASDVCLPTRKFQTYDSNYVLWLSSLFHKGVKLKEVSAETVNLNKNYQKRATHIG